jgi:hypothetical protein
MSTNHCALRGCVAARWLVARVPAEVGSGDAGYRAQPASSPLVPETNCVAAAGLLASAAMMTELRGVVACLDDGEAASISRLHGRSDEPVGGVPAAPGRD